MLTQYQIQSICSEIQKDSHVAGILVTGSYVYGTPHEESDLDIRMIVEEEKYEKAHWDDMVRYGVRIEAFYNTEKSIYEYIEKARRKETPPNVIHFWAFGKIIYDPQGVAKRIQDDAKKIWKSDGLTVTNNKKYILPL